MWLFISAIGASVVTAYGLVSLFSFTQCHSTGYRRHRREEAAIEPPQPPQPPGGACP